MMSCRARWPCGAAAATLILAAGLARGQRPNTVRLLPDPNTGALACPAGTDFEAAGYQIANVSVNDPFKFLYQIGGKANSIEATLYSDLHDKPFRYRAVESDSLTRIDQTRLIPDTPGSFAVTLVFVSVTNCDSINHKLDVIYRIYSTAPPKFAGGAAESAAKAETAPQESAGLDRLGNRFHLRPLGGYDRSFAGNGGGSLRVTSLGPIRLFDTLSLDGRGSRSMREISGGLSGSATLDAWIQHLDWRLNYGNNSKPAGGLTLGQADGSAQADAQTRPFWNNTTFARFGAMVERGIMQGTASASLLPQNTLDNTGYKSLKMYTGLSSSARHNVLSASYGLELGATGSWTRVDWRKHIGDVMDQFWIQVKDHRPLEVESRFTVGALQVPHAIPLAARFFGGGDSAYFVPGDAWQISDVPVIRAIPANRLFMTGQGAGAERFTSLNLTLSYPARIEPIVPTDVRNDPEFKELLAGQLVSATSADQNYYSWKDPHFAMAYAEMPKLAGLLDTLQNAVNAAQDAHPDILGDEFGDCSTQIFTAAFHVNSAQTAMGIPQYGDVAVLLPADPENDLQAVHDSCRTELNGQLNDPAVDKAAADVDTEAKVILDDFNAIDQKAAAAKASSDIAFAKKSLNTLFQDLNIFSIAPVAVLDVASIGPDRGSLGGTRLGPGAGIRLELASYVNFTVGYAWNLNRGPNEGRGALFFSIGFRDLFH